jgi:thiamine transport system permease protein
VLRILLLVLVVSFFLVFVLLPTLFVLSFAVTGFGDLQRAVFGNPERMALISGAVTLSFQVAIAVTLIDLAFGLPLAWFVVRREFRGKRFLNTLIDSPLAVSTAGLGFSVALFWGITPGITIKPPGAFGLTADAFLVLALLHFTTTFPYMVRALAAILEEIDVEYEVAARTCGASRLTAARTVTLPMFRSGLATGAVLTLAKALSDTGGVIAVLTTVGRLNVDTTNCQLLGEPNGTALIGTWRQLADACPQLSAELTAGLAFVSILMIGLALALLVVVKLLATRARIPFRKVFPRWEMRLSRGLAPRLRNVAAFAFLGLFVLVPSFFLFGYIGVAEPEGAIDWGLFWSAIGLSFFVGGVATAIDLAAGVPFALLIVRGKHRRLGAALDTLVNIPYIVPSAALGFSLFLFWVEQPVVQVPSVLLLIIMAHVAFTFPFVVRNAVGALEQLDPNLEDTARTLGAKPLQVFRRITFPAIKASILAGAIMAFTRSLGETGATLAIDPNAITVPVFLVRLIQAQSYYQAALAQIVLIGIAFAAILLMRYVVRRAK